MTLIEKIKACQTKVGASPDGKPGVDTWDRIFAALGLKEPKGLFEDDAKPVDARSEKAIATLHAKVKPYARALVQQSAAQGIVIKITSGTRTYAEQDALFKKGNVTKARGGHSNHNFGLAFDVTIFNGATPVWSSPNYKAVGSLGINLGLEWGGSWKSFVDQPHFQLRPAWAKDLSESAMLAELRKRKASGTDALA